MGVGVRAYTLKNALKSCKGGTLTFWVPNTHFEFYSKFGRVECADSKKQKKIFWSNELGQSWRFFRLKN